MLTRFPILFALLLALWASPSGAAQNEAIALLPHRAVYDLQLAPGSDPAVLAAARGRIVLDFTGAGCDGYSLTFRQVTTLEAPETGSRTLDMHSSTFETKDGSFLRFDSETRSAGAVLKQISGEAVADASGGATVTFSEPPGEPLVLAEAPSFPTTHLKRIIAAGRAGRTTTDVRVYDGSEDGRTVYETLAVIGKRVEAGRGANSAGETFEALAASDHWPVTLSYFAPGAGEQTPLYVLSFELFDNGVSRDLRLDYGDFALTGELVTLEPLPDAACETR